MSYQASHLSDEQLLLEIDGELKGSQQATVGSHLDACWECRARRQEIQNAITDFVRVYPRESGATLPPVAGQRALLRAQLAQLAEGAQGSGWFAWRRALKPASAAALAVMAMALLVLGSVAYRSTVQRDMVIVSLPDARLTPGAATLSPRQAVCSQANVKNKAVSMAVQRQVFAEYGIPAAEPRAYEVDYLVTPALGGADDLRNLWPHSYSTIWNAKVKDDLEDRLRAMVCDGSLDLAEAQHEIATNWIVAYKKYFHTEQPLAGR